MKYIFFISTLILVRTFSFGQAQKFDFFDGTDNQTSGLMRNAKNQIEKVRKGNLMLEFINQSGKKVNAHAVIEQQAHDFDFGADLYGFHSMSDNDPAKAMALKAIDTLFNTVIICDYWGVNQNKLDGSHNWDSPDYGFKIANELAKKPRYHALIYGFPHWLDGFSEEELWGKIEDRIKHVADKYGDLITEVDVINEFINYQYWDKNPHAKYLRTTKFPDFAKPENGLRVLQIARKYLPKAKLVVLESAIWSANNPVFQEIYNYHKYLVEHNAPYDYIGYQAHYYAQGLPFQEGTPEFGPRTFMMDEIEKGLDQIAKLGKPIVITEFNPPSRSNESKNPNPPGISDEEVAAWETNFYTLLFSKPYINGISRWFTVDNLGGKGMDAGVVTENGKLKPNYFALKRLIKDKWHTKWEGHVHENVAFEGFYGTYKVTIDGYEEVKVSLTKENNKQLIKLEKR
jgi:GH35 family endo-1,4-beta-xylanase